LGRTTPLFFIWFMIASYILIGLSCVKKDTPVGADLIDPGDSFLQTVTISPPIADSFGYAEINLWQGENLLVGDYEDIQARTLVKFDFSEIFSDTAFVDTFVITQAVMRLVMHEVFPSVGDPANQVHFLIPVEEDWAPSLVSWTVRDTVDSDTLFWDNPGVIPTDQISGRKISEAVIGSTADTNFVEIDFDLTQWINQERPDTLSFLIITYDDTDWIRHFYSRNGGVSPEIFFYDQTDTAAVDTMSFSTEADVTILGYDTPIDDENGEKNYFQVRNGVRQRAVMKFDLPDSLKDVNVNHAELTLTVDGSHSSYIDYDMDIGIYMIAELAIDDSTGKDKMGVAVDSISVAYYSRYTPIPEDSPAEDDESLTFDGNSMDYVVQDWLSGSLENHGFFIRSTSESSDIEYLSFYSREADESLAPRLKIVYTRPISELYNSPSDSISGSIKGVDK